VDDKLDQVLQRLAAIETLIQTEAARCPYREDIARARNNIQRVIALEDIVNGVRLDLARAGAVGGGVVGIIVAVVLGVGKAARWW
jgi:hypothetical protein